MTCKKAMNLIYHYYGEPAPLFAHLQIVLHLFFCSSCTEKYERLKASQEILHNDFFPAAPNLENSIMNMIAAEENFAPEAQGEYPGFDTPTAPGELSLRGWVIAGLIILVSLTSAFFGLEFNQIALSEGTSFLLPFGITIGIVLTSYGALFICCHLKELSKRFRL